MQQQRLGWSTAHRGSLTRLLALVVALSTLAAIVFVPSALAKTTERMSLADDESEGNGRSHTPVLSADARYVLFESGASNLVAGDTNGTTDLFVRDRTDGTTERVSLADDEAEVSGLSGEPAMTPDARFIAFSSDASNLVAGDTNSTLDIFVRDLATGSTERVSVSSDEEQGQGPSGNGFGIGLSADGRFVVFPSHAPNLVAGGTNGFRQMYVRDRLLGTTERVSVSSTGEEANDTTQGPVISADGIFVAFESGASNLVPGDTPLCDPFECEEPGFGDIFVRDLVNDTTERVSLSGAGEPGNGPSWFAALSADGRHVAFTSDAVNLVDGDTNGWYDVFLRDRLAGTTTRVSVASDGSQGAGYSGFPYMTPDSRFVVFSSGVETFVPGGETNGRGENDIFLHDTQTGVTDVVSVSSTGEEAELESFITVSLSANGCFVAFATASSNLAPGDTNGLEDVFLTSMADGDADCDGIADAIDAGDGTFSDGESSGSIVSVPAGVTVRVEDAPAPDGIRITVTGSGTQKATFSVCGSTLKLAPGSEVVLTCGSITVEVLEGEAELELGDDVVVEIPEGALATVADNGDGTFTVTNDPTSEAAVTVTTAGVVATIAAGEESLAATADASLGLTCDALAALEGGTFADKLEDVVEKCRNAEAELAKSSPDEQAALGSIEGAVGDLEAARADGLPDGSEHLVDLVEVARRIAVRALNAAAVGGDPGKLAAAQSSLGEGNVLRDAGRFKDAVAKYKDAHAKAGSA